ncbi:MAG: 50S ribosomal protein L25 [Candidatus Omnitrophota bacterium]
MEKVSLEAQPRQEQGKSKVKSLRREGFIPAVVYGAGKESQSLKLSRHDFLQFIQQHHLESAVLTLKVKGHEPRTVLVKEVQYHPVKDDVVHIDFQEISLTSKIKVSVGIVTKGEPVGVKQDGGVLDHILWELDVECLPAQIPEKIEVDVASMKVGDNIHVKDLLLPEGIKAINAPDSLVLSVEPPAKEKEIAAEAAEGEKPAEPEVIKEKKEAPEESEKKGA